MFKRLTGGDWFTSRTSACGLYAAAYPLVAPPLQDELRKLYRTLANDDTPMVRRAAATSLPKLVRVCAKGHLLAEMLPLFSALTQDDQVCRRRRRR